MLNRIDKIKAINNSYNMSSQKESNLFEVKKEFDNNFKNSSDYEPNTTINGSNQELLVVHDKDNKKKIISKSTETFNLGDIVECYGYSWIITEVDPNKQIYTIGRMSQCNYTLNFLSTKNLPISRPVIINGSAMSNAGIDNTNFISIGKATLKIQIPLDDETVFLNEDMRLLIDYGVKNPQAYIITFPNRITENDGCGNGIIELTLEKCESSKNDNVNLMIADYWNRINDTPPPLSTNCEIVYSGKSVIQVGLGYKKFTALFKNNEGQPIPKQPVWDIVVADDNLRQYIITEQSEDFIKIKVLNKLMIGNSFNLILSDIDKTMNCILTLGVTPIG